MPAVVIAPPFNPVPPVIEVTVADDVLQVEHVTALVLAVYERGAEKVVVAVCNS